MKKNIKENSISFIIALKPLFQLLLVILFFIPTMNCLYAQTRSYSGLSDLTKASNSRSMKSSSVDSNFDGNGDSKEIALGETIVIADLEGPGIIVVSFFYELKTYRWNFDFFNKIQNIPT